MSRIAKNSIKIDPDTSCKFENGNFFAKGKLGEMNLTVDPLYNVEIQLLQQAKLLHAENFCK